MPESATILIVDDVPDNLWMLETLLRSERVSVVSAGSGAEALQFLEKHDFAVGLIDVNMPDMDGFALAQAIRAKDHSSRMPIIFVTASSRDQQRLFNGYAAGAVDFLFKPIDTRILTSKVDVFVELHLQKRQLAAEVEKERELLKLNQLLCGAIGHDLRTPLQVMVSGANAILAKTSDPQLKRVGETIRSAANRMAHLTHDLLDFSQVQLNGSLILHGVKSDIVQIVHRVVHELELAHSSADVRMVNKGDTAGLWDAERMGQVIANLLGNALSHGSPNVPITIGIDGTDRNVLDISVHNGGYIPPEILPHIFNPFQTTSKTRSKNSGLGLGLYIVSRIVGAHGGQTEVTSTETGGTRFTVHLPRRLASAGATPAAAA